MIVDTVADISRHIRKEDFCNDLACGVACIQNTEITDQRFGIAFFIGGVEDFTDKTGLL